MLGRSREVIWVLGQGEFRVAFVRGGAQGEALAFGVERQVWDEVEPEVRRQWIMSFLKKVTESDRKGAVSQGPHDAEFALKYPVLWEYLTKETYPDGSKRQTASLNMFRGLQGWHGNLNDRDNSRQLWGASSSLEGLLESLEAQAGSEDPPWRNDMRQHGNNRRQK